MINDKNKNRDFIKKAWGCEEVIVNNDFYCGKLLKINREHMLGLHYHKIKRETFFNIDADVMVYAYDDPEIDKLMFDWDKFYKIAAQDNGPVFKTILKQGESFYIPRGRRHAIFGLNNSTIVETSTEHFEEDSYRILPSY